MTATIRSERRQRKFARWLVVAGTGFNLVLCFVSTHLHAVGKTEVTVCELAILGLGLAMVWRTLDRDVFCISGLVIGWLVAIHIIDPTLGQTTLVALAIPLIYFALGSRWGTPEAGDGLVLGLSLATIAVGVLELEDPALYQRLFDVLAYYIGKGGLEASQADVTGTHFFVSGVRPAGEGRSLLPFLGDHRVSSLFLEPISAGDFAVVCAAWGLARYRARPRFVVLILAMAAVNAVLADSRLAVGCAVIIAAVLATPLWRVRIWLTLLPLGIVAFILVTGWISVPRVIDDTLAGRIYGAGVLLDSWNIGQWLGVAASPQPTVDCGYAQLLAGLGIVPIAGLWAAFTLRNHSSRLADRFRCALAIYLCISLSITGSVLSIKTGALAWFLYGATQMTAEQFSLRRTAKVSRQAVMQSA